MSLNLKISGVFMSLEISYAWKEEDSKDAALVKAFVDSVIKGLEKVVNPDEFELKIAQSDRLIDFSILVMLVKSVEEMGGETLFDNWKTLSLAHEDIEMSRLFQDPETKKEIEIFHLQEDKKISIFTYIHFYKPQEDTENKIYNLEIEGKSVGESFTRVLDFLKK